MAIQVRVPQLDEGTLQAGGNAMQTTGLAHTVRGMYIPAIDTYAGFAETGKRIAEFGNAFFQFAKEQETIKQQAEAQTGLNEMQEQMDQAYVEYSQQKGQNAIAAYDTYQKKIGEIQRNISDKYNRTNFIQNAIQLRGGQITSQYRQRGFAYQAGETTRWRDDELKAAINRDASNAVKNFNDPVACAEDWKSYDNHMSIYLQTQGVDPNSATGLELKDHFRTNALSSMVEYAIQTKQFGSAQRQLEDYKDKINGESYIKLLGRLKAQQQAEAEHQADRARMLKNDQIATLHKILTNMKESGNIEGYAQVNGIFNQMLAGSTDMLDKSLLSVSNYDQVAMTIEQYENSPIGAREKMMPGLLKGIEEWGKQGILSPSQVQALQNRVTEQAGKDYKYRGQNGLTEAEALDFQYQVARQLAEMRYRQSKKIPLGQTFTEAEQKDFDGKVDTIIQLNADVKQQAIAATKARMLETKAAYNNDLSALGQLINSFESQFNNVNARVNPNLSFEEQLTEQQAKLYNQLPPSQQEEAKAVWEQMNLSESKVYNPATYNVFKSGIDNNLFSDLAELTGKMADANLPASAIRELQNQWKIQQNKAVADFGNDVARTVTAAVNKELQGSVSDTARAAVVNKIENTIKVKVAEMYAKNTPLDVIRVAVSNDLEIQKMIREAENTAEQYEQELRYNELTGDVEEVPKETPERNFKTWSIWSGI